MVDYKKRLFAYLIDIAILLVIIFIIGFIFPKSNTVIKLENSLTDLNVLLTSKQINIYNYLKEYSSVIHEIDINRALSSIINAFFIIIYFVIIPFYKGGQTYGQQVFKIRVAKKDGEFPSIRELLVRSFVINGLLYMLISLGLLYLLPRSLYFLVVSILGIIQLFLVIRSAFMIKYKKNKEGLQDILSKTYVIENIEV